MRKIAKLPLWTKLLVCSISLLACAVVLLVNTRATTHAQDPDGFRPIADFPAIVQAWEASPHGNTYGEGKGPNTYCSRCHSPQNWDSSAMPGPPPNCVTCKFPSDDEMRMAPTMDFVSEEDWIGIGCATCHQVKGDTINATEIAWLNPISDEYVAVATPNELCEMCHVDSTGVSSTGGRGVDHKVILGGSAHQNWAATIGVYRPEQCTDCHNPHTQEPQQCVDCHSDVTESETHINGLNAVHLDRVSCIACHDASGAAVAPHPDESMGGVFTTVEYSVGRSGEPTVTAIVSHSQQWLVACDRCHFADNEWDLVVLTADGEVEETSD